jgi:TatD DNase family protein
MWSDSHCHLHDERLREALPALLAACRHRGIQRWIVNATREEDWHAVEKLWHATPGVLPAFGLHPWWIHQRKSGWENRLRLLLTRYPGASLGETGLDLWMQNPDLEDQKNVLLAHMELAREWNRPLSIHCLKAWPPLLALFQKNAPLPRGFLLHSYAGPAAQIPEWTALGAYFSFSPAFLASRRAETQRLFTKHIPLSRLLIETDSPDMAPPAELCLARVPPPLSAAATPPTDTSRTSPESSGSPRALNHPLNLLLCGEFLAREHNLPLKTIQTLLNENFQRLWGLGPTAPGDT